MNIETKHNLKEIAWRNLPVVFIIPGAFLAGAAALGHDRLAMVAELLGFSFGTYLPCAVALILVGGGLRYELGMAGLAFFGLGCAVVGAMLSPDIPVVAAVALGMPLLVVGITLAIFIPR